MAKAKRKLPSGRHASQIKRERQTLKRAERNRRIRAEYRTFVKKVRQAVEVKDQNLAQASLKDTISKIDKAISKGVLHRNTGSRTISRLSKLVSTLSK